MEAEVSPPSWALLHTHTFGNQFFTGQLPCDLCQPSQTHTRMLLANYGHTQGMITVAVHPPTHTHTHTRRNLSRCAYTHTPQPLQRHKIWQPALFMKGMAPSCSRRQTDTHSPTYLAGIFFIFFSLVVCLKLCPIHSPSLGSANSIISDYFLISIAALIHLLVTYLCCTSPTIKLIMDIARPRFFFYLFIFNKALSRSLSFWQAAENTRTDDAGRKIMTPPKKRGGGASQVSDLSVLLM